MDQECLKCRTRIWRIMIGQEPLPEDGLIETGSILAHAERCTQGCKNLLDSIRAPFLQEILDHLKKKIEECMKENKISRRKMISLLRTRLRSRSRYVKMEGSDRLEEAILEFAEEKGLPEEAIETLTFKLLGEAGYG